MTILLFNIVKLKAALLSLPGGECRGNGSRSLVGRTSSSSWRVARLPSAPALEPSAPSALTAPSSNHIACKIRPTTAARHNYRRSSTKGAYITLLGASAPAEQDAGSERPPTLASPPTSGREQTNTLANPLAIHQSQRDTQPPPPTCREVA